MSNVGYRVSCVSLIMAAGCGAGSTSTESPRASAEADTVSGATLTGLGGKCLDVQGGSTADRATVQIWDCNGLPWQNWSYQNETLVGIGGKCLDVNGAGTADGTRVQLYTCNGSVAQVWQFTSGELVNPNSGKCLDVSADNNTNGAVVQIWDCWDGPNQQWSLGGAPTPTPTPTPSPVTPGGTGFVSNCTYQGGIYYVAPDGSDGADGSQGAPWATLDHASASVHPGDTVRIRGNAGTFTPGTQPTINA